MTLDEQRSKAVWDRESWFFFQWIFFYNYIRPLLLNFFLRGQYPYILLFIVRFFSTIQIFPGYPVAFFLVLVPRSQGRDATKNRSLLQCVSRLSKTGLPELRQGGGLRCHTTMNFFLSGYRPFDFSEPGSPGTYYYKPNPANYIEAKGKVMRCWVFARSTSQLSSQWRPAIVGSEMGLLQKQFYIKKN